MLTDELRYKLLKVLHQNPDMTQREMAKELGVSLGKVNYCVNALLEVGLIKASNFKNSKNKLSYSYLLTPKGIENKRNVTVAFLQRKIVEHEAIMTEIYELKREAAEQHIEMPPSVEKSLENI